MYACICMHVYVCMYMYVCICMYVYVCLYVCVCVYVCVYVCMYVCVCVCMHTCVCMYVCITYWGRNCPGEMSYPKREGELSGGVIVRGNCPAGIIQGRIVLHP